MASMGTTQVAVKKLNNQNLSLQLLKDFRREVEVFRQLQVRKQYQTTVFQQRTSLRGNIPLVP